MSDHGEKFVLSAFPKNLYRFHIEAQRALDLEQSGNFRRTFPLRLFGITRIIRLDDVRNPGEGATYDGVSYPERQHLRIIAEIDDDGEKGVMCVTLDRRYGTVGFRFS